jgi:outer membrane protein assembly factor BamB
VRLSLKAVKSSAPTNLNSQVGCHAHGSTWACAADHAHTKLWAWHPITSAVLAVLMMLPLAARADDWFQFRGPEGEGHSTAVGLPIRWSKTQNVRWRQPLPDRGWSSPVCVGNQIFLTSAVPKGSTHSLHALSIDAVTGKILWDETLFDGLVADRARIHSKNSHASPTPIAEGGRLFVHFGTHGTACLSYDGKVLWKMRDLVYQPNHGSGGSPVLIDGLLVVSCDGADRQFVAAIDADSGRVRWRKVRPPSDEPKKFAFGTPLVIEVNGHKQVVCPGANWVVAYDPPTGDEIWRVRYDGYSVVPRPVYGNGLIYLSTSFDSSQELAIRPDGHGDVTDSHVAWRQSHSMPSTPSPILVGEDLYLISDAGVASCLDAKTGKPRWVHRIGGGFSASLTLSENRIYAVSEGGETTIFRATGDKYVEIARNKLDERTLASPAVIDRGLIFRTDAALYRIENN